MFTEKFEQDLVIERIIKDQAKKRREERRELRENVLDITTGCCLLCAGILELGAAILECRNANNVSNLSDDLSDVNIVVF